MRSTRFVWTCLRGPLLKTLKDLDVTDKTQRILKELNSILHYTAKLERRE
jgi:hypothetical protein